MKTPQTIAIESFSIIRQHLDSIGHVFEPPFSSMAAVVERVIHSTADFEFAKLTRTSPGAIEYGHTALSTGCSIITDVTMVKAGISAPRLAQFGCITHCFVANEEVRTRAEVVGITRSAMGMRIAAERGLFARSIIAIGNAPTALAEVVRIVETMDNIAERPALVIGVPVGFVGTVESKTALMEQHKVPWIVTTGYKGGSTVAVAILNALLRLARGESPTTTD